MAHSCGVALWAVLAVWGVCTASVVSAEPTSNSTMNTTTAFDGGGIVSRANADTISVALTGIAYTGALIGTPCAVLQVHRAMSLLQVSQCGDATLTAHRGELGFPISAWPGYGFGDATGAFYRGGVIANMVTLLFCVVAGFGFTLLFGVCGGGRRAGGKWTSESPLHVGMMQAQFPAFLLIPCGLLSPGLVTSSIATLIFGGEPGRDVPLGLVGLLLALSFVVLLFYAAEFVIPRNAIALELPHPWHFGWRSACFGFDRSWVPRAARAGDRTLPTVLVKALGPLVQPFDPASRWYIAAEAFATLTCSLIQGAMSNDEDTCRASLGALVAPMALVTLVVVWRRPDARAPVREALNVTCLLLVLLASILCVVAVATRTPALMAAGQVIAICGAAGHALTSAVSWVKVLLDCIHGPLPPVGRPARVQRDSMMTMPSRAGAHPLQAADDDAGRFVSSSLLGINRAFDPLLLDATVARELLHTEAKPDDDDAFVEIEMPVRSAPEQQPQSHNKDTADDAKGAEVGRSAAIDLDDDDEAALPIVANPFTAAKGGAAKPLRIFRPAEGQRLHDELTWLFKHGTATTAPVAVASDSINSDAQQEGRLPVNLDDLL